VRLPSVDVAPTGRGAPAHDAHAAAAAGARVLIIDDNEDSAQALAMCLEASGYDVRLSHSGAHGVDAALECLPDAVLLDIGLPDMDGYEVARLLRRHQSLSAVPLIAITGFSGRTERTRAERAGIDRYLVKPIDYKRLVGIISEHMSGADGDRESASSPA
jgi:DNA-binding response OmpR family regulator